MNKKTFRITESERDLLERYQYEYVCLQDICAHLIDRHIHDVTNDFLQSTVFQDYQHQCQIACAIFEQAKKQIIDKYLGPEQGCVEYRFDFRTCELYCTI